MACAMKARIPVEDCGKYGFCQIIRRPDFCRVIHVASDPKPQMLRPKGLAGALTLVLKCCIPIFRISAIMAGRRLTTGCSNNARLVDAVADRCDRLSRRRGRKVVSASILAQEAGWAICEAEASETVGQIPRILRRFDQNTEIRSAPNPKQAQKWKPKPNTVHLDERCGNLSGRGEFIDLFVDF